VTRAQQHKEVIGIMVSFQPYPTLFFVLPSTLLLLCPFRRPAGHEPLQLPSQLSSQSTIIKPTHA